MISNDVKAVLSQMIFDGNIAKFPEEMGQLERELYTEVNTVLERLGGKWKRGKGHIFPYEPGAAIQAVIETGIMPDKNPHAYFPTPEKLVEEMIHWAGIDKLSSNISSEDRVLDPSAGCGRIVSALVQRGFTNVDAVEIDPINSRTLQNLPISVYEQDFLTFKPSWKYKYILMNPPFLGDTWVAHVEHAWSLLEDDGVLVAIVPEALHWKDNSKVKTMRELVMMQGSYEFNEKGAFKESGTSVGTCMLKMEKDVSQRYAPTSGWGTYAAWYAYTIAEQVHDFYLEYQKMLLNGASYQQIKDFYADVIKYIADETRELYILQETDYSELFDEFVREYQEIHSELALEIDQGIEIQESSLV